MTISDSIKDLLDTLAKAQGSTISQEALDEWKDAFLEGFEAVLVKAQSRKLAGETRIASTEFGMLTARMESIETGIAELRNEFAESRKGTALVLSRFEEVLDQHGGRVDKLMESNDRLPDSVSRLFYPHRKEDRQIPHRMAPAPLSRCHPSPRRGCAVRECDCDRPASSVVNPALPTSSMTPAGRPA